MAKLKTVSKRHLDYYFAFARERYRIFLKRQAGEPAPWTDWPILQKYRFTNVFREDDVTTRWFRENIREPMRDKPSVVLATVAFRWFNRISTGELLKPYILADDWDLRRWKHDLEAQKAAGLPICTGAYIIKTRAGISKIDGILEPLAEAKMKEPQILQWLRETPPAERTQEGLWRLLCRWSYMGEFTANEVVVDLWETAILDQATDLLTWTNPGPGCAAGIGLLLHNDAKAYNRHSENDRAAMMEIMAHFLEVSRDPQYWPAEWPQWKSIHQSEWLFCEVSKLIRAEQGKRPKRRYQCQVESMLSTA